MTLKRKIVVSLGVLLLLLFCGLFYISWPFLTIRQLQGRYERVQRGMNVEEVQALMVHSPIHASDQWVPLWDDERLPLAEEERIVSAFRYSVKTFYMPVFFEFTFDSQRRLVGKHRYD